jgi:hypothetical protein
MSRRTCDHPPTLTDSQVLEFCRQGYLILPGVVPEEINRRAFAYLETNTHYEPTQILDFDWFQDHVICNPAAAGAVRSLLGPGYGLPVLMSNHRRQCPHEGVGGWHVDGGSRWGPQLNDLQVFYYPQDTPLEMGPTEVVPGTHLVPNTQRAMAHYGRIRGSASTAAPAGTIFLTAYRIWHRATAASGSGIRNLLKYCYWRNAPPARDWLREPDFDLARANFSGPAAGLGEQFHECYSAAEMFCWLAGQHHHYQVTGGQSWPLPAHRNDLPYGFNPALATR